MTVEQFGKAIVASGLMTADDVKAFWNGIPADARPKTSADFGKLLVEKSLLTPFQVAEIIAGRGARLIMGDYTIVAQIGAGGMGQVYKAQHKRMKRTVALKVMSNAAMQDEAAVKRFQREVHAAARLEHPNIVTAYDSGESGNVKYLVMQFVDGGDLSDLVKKGGRLPIEQAVGYVIQAARGLAFAHGEGVIHRDIKPANLLLDKKGIVKILDMGLARFEDGGDGLTATEQVMGTVDYMSPEQAANTKGCDGRADIYSLGCTLWFLLTGKKLYEADTLIARLMLHRDGPLPSLVKERDDAPWPLEQALHKMIAKRAADRYQSMDEVIAALAPFGGTAAGGSGGGSSPSISQNADLASFMKSMNTGGGTKTNVSATQIKPATNIDATAQFTAPEAGTDPKSQVLPKSATMSKPQPATNAAKKPAKPGNNKTKLIATGGALVGLALLAGIIVKIRDKDGNVVAEVNAPTGVSAEVITQPLPAVRPVTPATSTLTISQMLDSPEYVWTTPENLGAPVNGPRQQDLFSLTNDQLRLYFRHRGGPEGNQDELCEVVRSSLTLPFGEPRVIGNGGSEGFVSGDGLTFVNAAADVYIHRRGALDESFGASVNLGPQINSSTWERNPTLSPNGLTLLYSSDRNPQERKPLWISRRKSRDESFGPAENRGSPVNAPDHVLKALQLGDDRTMLLWLRNNRWYRTFTNTSGITGVMPLSDSPFHDTPHVWIAPDGKTAYFSADRPGGLGNTDIYVTQLVPKNSATPNSPLLVSPTTSNLTAAQLLESPDYVWTTPENLGPSINGPGHQDLSSLTSDQTRLYFNRKAADGKTDELCEVVRASISSPFGEPKLVTVSASDAFVSHDGLSLYSGSPDISVRQRAVFDIPFGAAGKIDAISSSSTENHPTLSPDGLTLIFNSGRDQNAEKSNLYISQRRSPGEPFGPPSKLGPAVNTTSYEHKGFMLADRRTIIFVRDAWYMTTTRSDGKQVALTLPTHPFGQTTFLWLAPDGRTAYFSADLPGGLGDRDIYVTRRVPKSGGAPSVPSFVASVSPSFVTPTTPASPPPPGDYALLFVQQNKVEAPNPQLDESQPFTVEAYITSGDADPNNRHIGVRLFGVDAEFHFEIKDSRWRFYSTHNEALSPEQFKPRRRVHVAGVRTTTGRLLYLDGKLVASKDDPLRLASKESETPLLLQAHGAIEFTFDEIRISQGIVYDKEFVPPPKLTADANTLALYHFDEGFGDVLKDSSGKGRDGKITGATWVKADGSPIPAVATSTLPATAMTIPAEASTFAGHRYLLVDSFGTWSQAKAKAEALGGHLATVNSKEEREWIIANLIQTRPRVGESSAGRQVFFGGVIDGSADASWKWVTGEPFDESLWLGNKPVVAEKCGLSWYSDRYWGTPPTDDNGKRSNFFLVEWDALGPTIASTAAPAGTASQRIVATPAAAAPAVVRWPLAATAPEEIAWLKSLNARLVLRNGTIGDHAVPFNGSMPTGDWTVVGVELNRERWQDIDDQVLGRIGKLVDLEVFMCDFPKEGTRCTQAGMAQLKQLKNLRQLSLGRLVLSSADPKILEAFPKLESLTLRNGQFSGWEPYAARMDHLKFLSLYMMDDADLKRLGVRPRLVNLRFAGYQYFHPKRLAAVQPFAAANPWCRVTFVGLDGDNMKELVVEPTAPPPPAAATNDASTGNAMLAPGAIDLLPHVRIDQPIGGGVWNRSNDGVAIPNQQYARTIVDYEVPDEYELIVEVLPQTGNHSLVVGLSRAGKRFWIPVSGWRSATTKIEPDTNVGSGQAKSTALRLVPGKLERLTFTVRRDGVKLVDDSTVLIDWKGDTTQIPEWEPWKVPEPSKPAFGSWAGTMLVRRLELRPLTAAKPTAGSGNDDVTTVAKWLLDNKKLAKIRFEIDGRTQMLSTVPTGPFKVVELNFSKDNNAGQSLSEVEVGRLAVFTDLESLELLTLTDAELAKLAPLKKLKSLILANNTLTPAAVATIRQFPQLEQLQASGNDEWLKPLAGMPTLRSMIFWKANVSPQAMSWFPQYPNLDKLRLNDCFEAPQVRLSVALTPLKDCRNLKKLFLNSSKFDADALAVLSGLTGLTELDLHQSNVSVAQLKQLAAALPRCQIKWRDAANNFKQYVFEPTAPPKP